MRIPSAQHLAIPVAVALLLASPLLHAQRVTIEPPVLYPGENVLTVTLEEGIGSLTLGTPEQETGLYEATGVAIPGACATTATISIRVNTASHPIRPVLQIVRCSDEVTLQTPLQLNTTWNLDEVPFPDVEPGETVCRPFQIRIDGVLGSDRQILDSVSSTDPRVTFDHPVTLPTTIYPGSTYRYTVCFRSDQPGTYRFPVITWIRRDRPAGGHTTYPVADTGLVRVVPVTREIITEELEISERVESTEESVRIDPSSVDSIEVRGTVRTEEGKDPGLTLQSGFSSGWRMTPATLVVKDPPLREPERE